MLKFESDRCESDIIHLRCFLLTCTDTDDEEQDGSEDLIGSARVSYYDRCMRDCKEAAPQCMR